MTSGDSPINRTKQKHPCFSLQVPREGFPDLEEVGIQEVCNSHSTKLIVKNIKRLTLLSESQDEHSDSVVERPTTAMKNSLQVQMT
jgi:hypothetical protein